MPRIAVISDIHSNMHALCAVMEDYQCEQCTDVVCLGDVVGYNAYPQECVDAIRAIGCPVVKGNHDEEVCRMDQTRMNPIARQAMEWTRKQLNEESLTWLSRLPMQRIERSMFVMVHSSLDQPKAWNYILNANDAVGHFAKQGRYQLSFHGHTHQPRVFTWDKRYCVEQNHHWIELNQTGQTVVYLQPGLQYFINVGSVGQPRDGDPRACYAIYDTDAATVTLRRVEYKVEEAQQAILAYGLPAYLAERLATGQ